MDREILSKQVLSNIGRIGNRVLMSNVIELCNMYLPPLNLILSDPPFSTGSSNFLGDTKIR